VDADVRNAAARRQDGLTVAERRWWPDRVDREVDAVAAGEVQSAGDRVFFSAVDHGGRTKLLRHPQAMEVDARRRLVRGATVQILNPKTATSQVVGGLVWGISMALHEEAMTDHKLGRIMNHNLAEYHVPVNADVHDIKVIFVDEPDAIINPLGIKGLGEIGIVGVAAAIANAVYHATGKRVRDLPITLDKLQR